MQRLAAAHLKPAGDAASDALTALVPLTGALAQLLPTTNAALAAALDSPRIAVSLPPEARAMPQARVLRLLTSRGEMVIATSGPETGGSQFFLCHSPQPHLDGRYTVAGQLRSGDEVLDALQPGDTILSASAE